MKGNRHNFTAGLGKVGARGGDRCSYSGNGNGQPQRSQTESALFNDKPQFKTLERTALQDEDEECT